jgi:pimeloyl-ACP methyl ester carboxylesterase
MNMERVVEHGYVPAAGVDIYWESRGQGGTPLIVTHGGYGLTSMFGALLDRLAGERRVVAIELQGHGHTRDVDKPFTWEAFGDQIAGVIDHLGFDEADLLGYSLGGHASLRCAIQHPEKVRRLALVSIPCRRDGWFPEVLAGFDSMSSALFEHMRQAPMYAAYRAVAPDPDAFPALMDKTGELLRIPYDWRDEVPSLDVPTLLVYADADAVPTSHMAEFYGLLGGGLRDATWDGSQRSAARLAVLPGLTHYDIFTAPALADVVAAFLD